MCERIINLDSSIAESVYNVTMAVGPNGSNKRDDVLLVQYLMNKIFAGRPEMFGETVNVDGKPGPITFRAILAFQTFARDSAQVNIATDGRVDHARGKISSITHTVYTIVTMCIFYKNVLIDAASTTEEGLARYENLDKEPDCPPEVKAAIGPSPGNLVTPS